MRTSLVAGEAMKWPEPGQGLWEWREISAVGTSWWVHVSVEAMDAGGSDPLDRSLAWGLGALGPWVVGPSQILSPSPIRHSIPLTQLSSQWHLPAARREGACHANVGFRPLPR